MIYLDNAATTRMEPGVLDAMTPYFDEYYGNPSANYSFAEKSWQAVEHAREIISDFIGAYPEEIIFTSGGTEADNMVMNSFGDNKWVVYSPIEHKAVLNSLPYKSVALRVGRNGLVMDLEDHYWMPGELVSVMLANNELGTIQNVWGIANFCNSRKLLLHTDAVQAFGHPQPAY